MSDKEVEEYIKRLDEGLALAEQEMLQDKASRNETIVYSDGHGNINALWHQMFLPRYTRIKSA